MLNWMLTRKKKKEFFLTFKLKLLLLLLTVVDVKLLSNMSRAAINEFSISIGRQKSNFSSLYLLIYWIFLLFSFLTFSSIFSRYRLDSSGSKLIITSNQSRDNIYHWSISRWYWHYECHHTNINTRLFTVQSK